MKYLVIALMLVNLNAWADREFATKGMAQVNSTLMGSPALPSLHGPNNQYELSLKPAVFTAQTSTPRSVAINDGGYVDLSGNGLAVMFHKYLNSNFGIFFMGMGNTITGEAESNFGGNYVKANNIDSSMFQVGGGISYTAWRGKFMPIQFFIGPSYTSTSLKQTVISGTGDDFDMEANPGVLSYMLGFQAGLYLSQWFAINPYYIAGDLVNEEDRCQTFDANARSTGHLWDFSDPNCHQGQNSSTSQFYYDTKFDIFGLNILIPRWNLTFNIFTSAEDLKGFQDAPIEMYSITLTL